MKPDVTEVLEDFSEILSSDVSPKLSGFQAGNVAMIAAMLKMLSELWDGSAARLIEENNAFRTILIEAQGTFGDPRVTSMGMSGDTDFHLSALERNNQDLRRQLIKLHEQVEQIDDEKAREINRRIWDELRTSVKRREISSANF